MVPLVIGGLFATASVGIFIAKVPAQYIFGVSMFSFFIGNLLMSFANYSNVYWAFIFPACLLVVGGPDLAEVEEGIDSGEEGTIEPTTTLRDELGDSICAGWSA